MESFAPKGIPLNVIQDLRRRDALLLDKMHPAAFGVFIERVGQAHDNPESKGAYVL